MTAGAGAEAAAGARTTISAGYAEMNRTLHESEEYGVSGERWAPSVAALCRYARSRDVLDYGCGKGTLGRALGWEVGLYDPAIPGLDARPGAADIVACTDVLEHIEPEHLDAVLDDLRRVTRRFGFFVIATRPALKVLPDGRNAHLIQQPWSWWEHKLASRFRIREVKEREGEFAVIAQALEPRNP